MSRRSENLLVLLHLSTTTMPFSSDMISQRHSCFLGSKVWTLSGTRFDFLAIMKKAIVAKDQKTAK